MARRTSKLPAEIFGFPIDNQSPEALKVRGTHSCPFMNVKCIKKSRLIGYPMGVCSVIFSNDVVALCPKRFLQANRVFEDIADARFGTRHDLMVFSEVKLRPIGSFDFIMVKHRPMSSKIEDFVAIEFQTGQTTATGKLVQGLKDFVVGEDISQRTYGFGLNLYDIWKRSFTQILNKGIVMEAWRKNIYWVVQLKVFQDLLDRYRLGEMNLNADHSTVFSIYDLEKKEGQYHLVPQGLRSSSVDALFQAFRNNQVVPDRRQFEHSLSLKMQANIGFTIG